MYIYIKDKLTQQKNENPIPSTWSESYKNAGFPFKVRSKSKTPGHIDSRFKKIRIFFLSLLKTGSPWKHPIVANKLLSLD